ncbi:hypothetical protein IAE35_00580 [Pseudomonas sp. S75]|uniref:hypothetical protein n=1 Tax=unclassified Pseudomonas TaxID=196821 RepID=UPI0019037266|nr:MULTISPECIES: hypothetical protein [unclassified Pseudomonas]MBJ9974238.1 hypothetical protein [Pseudomonas sp. S30]MBK0151832.1 hypothetical protein [Pseudomonas sp. S75]
MSTLQFQPEMSFIASCHWQLHDTPVTLEQWDETSDMYRSFWVEFNDWNGDDGWLLTSNDYDDRGLGSYLIDGATGSQVRKRYVTRNFWFGVYRHADGYVYEIRPAYDGRNAHAWPNLDYWLDVSRNGYLGFYRALSAAGVCVNEKGKVTLRNPNGTTFELPIDPPLRISTPLYSLTCGRRTPLWHIPALNPTALKEHDVFTNLALYSPNGYVVRRRVERVAYLNDSFGARGAFTMVISNPCVPPHPSPQA